MKVKIELERHLHGKIYRETVEGDTDLEPYGVGTIENYVVRLAKEAARRLVSSTMKDCENPAQNMSALLKGPNLNY
jgi:hypothetical protein